MEELIKVVYDNDRITLSARELHEFLESNERFSKWFERMVSYGFSNGIDFTTAQKSTLVNNGAQRELQDHQITIEMAKEIAMIQRSDKGKQARKYFIECEKQLRQPQSMEDMMIYQLKEMKRIRIAAENAEKMAAKANDDIQGIRDVVALNNSDWRRGTTILINRIAQELGGNEYIKTVRDESYKLLSQRIPVSLETRLTNKRRRMAEEGVCKSKRDKLTKLDIIADDPKVLECYLSVVKDMAIKYGTSLPVEFIANDMASAQA